MGGRLLGFLDVDDTVGCPGAIGLVFFSEGAGSVEKGVVQAGEVVVQEDAGASLPFSVFRFLMISVFLSQDKNWMMIGVVPSLRLGRSWMAVISISGVSTWSLSWSNAMTFLFIVADSSMVWSAGESEDDVGWVWAQWAKE